MITDSYGSIGSVFKYFVKKQSQNNEFKINKEYVTYKMSKLWS